MVVVTVPVFNGSAPSSCRRWTRGRSSTCPPPCRGSRSPRRRSCSRSPTGSSSSSRRSTGCWGRPAGPRRSTDPAPLSMLETVITLKPKAEWRKVDTWYSSWAPEWLKAVFRHVTPDHISQEDLVSEMNEALKIPGLSNAWTMPIKARIDMLTTGIRTPVGLKISGADLDVSRRSAPGRVAPALRPGDAQRLRRAHRRRLLPRFRVEPRGAGPLRPEHRRGPGGGAERHRRGQRDHHGRRARALSGQRPLHARLPVRTSAPSAACWSRPPAGSSRSRSRSSRRSRP